MNNVTLSGQLSSDVSFHEHDGVTYAQVELRTLSTFEDPAGELHHRIDMHRVTLFDALARQVRSLKEGDHITVRGALRTSELETEDGRFFAVEIIGSEVGIRRPRPAGSGLPLATASAHGKPRTPRPRLARSCRRAHPSRKVHPLHPVDDAFLFDELTASLLGAGSGDEP